MPVALRPAEKTVRPLLEGGDHGASDLVRDGGADGGVERVGELEGDVEVDVGPRARGGAGTRGCECPACHEGAEDGAGSLTCGGRCSGARTRGVTALVPAAAGLDKAVRHAADRAGEGLVKPAPADAEVGLNRQPTVVGCRRRRCCPGVRVRTWARPTGHAGGMAKGHEGGVGVDVGYEVEEPGLVVGQRAGSREGLSRRRGEREVEEGSSEVRPRWARRKVGRLGRTAEEEARRWTGRHGEGGIRDLEAPGSRWRTKGGCSMS